MADVWVNAMNVVARSSWTPEFKQQIGESVLRSLYEKWMENEKLPKVGVKDLSPKELLEYMLKDNTQYRATITVSTS